MILEISIVIFLFMLILFLVSLIMNDNSVADIGWGIGFIVVSFASLFQGGVLDLARIVMNILILLWGVRLSAHIYLRNRGKGEDFRYNIWRQKWKFFILRSFFQVFMLQGLIMLMISAPVWYVNFSEPAGLSFFAILGFIIFLAGFYFELKSDHELVIFMKDPSNRGKIITTGLWSLTRHPNYFGETLIWWGIGLFALGYPYGWMTLAGPALLTFLLRCVSGVPMMEKYLQSRPGWDAYAKSTPVFFPKISIIRKEQQS